MDRNNASKPVFRVARGPGGLHIRVPVKSERFRSLINLVWLLVWAGGETALVLLMGGAFGSPGADPPASPPLAGLFLAAFTVAGGVVLWRWLWGKAGSESFLVSGNMLLARREIWGIGRSRKFELEKIRSVKAGPLKYRVIYPSWGRMFIGNEVPRVQPSCRGRC